MSFRIVLVSLAFFFIARGFVRAVAEGLILGKTAHANPDRLCLRFDFERSSVRFHNSAHDAKVTRAVRAWQALNPRTRTRYLRVMRRVVKSDRRPLEIKPQAE